MLNSVDNSPEKLKATRPPGYWRRLGRTAALGLLIGAVVLFVGLEIIIMRLTIGILSPKRLAVETTPAEYGMLEYETITLTAEDGVALAAWYVPGRNGAAVILAHGYAHNRTQLLPEAQFLTAAGYGVLLLDFRGHGDSADARVTVGDHERRDLRAAVDFLVARPEVDSDRIGALGFSMGGAAVTLAAAEDTRLRAVVIEGAFQSMNAVVTHDAGVFGPISELPARWALAAKGFEIDGNHPAAALCAISPRPVLLIYGTEDNTVPGMAAAMFAHACDPAETWLIDGAGHGDYIQVEPKAYPARVMAFFDDALR